MYARKSSAHIQKLILFQHQQPPGPCAASHVCMSNWQVLMHLQEVSSTA